MNGLYLEQKARNTFILNNNDKNKTLSKLNFKNKQIDELLKNDNNDKLNIFLIMIIVKIIIETIMPVI